jgi:hypothetical protein
MIADRKEIAMPIEATIKADTIEDFEELARRLARPSREDENGRMPAHLDPEDGGGAFLRARSPKQREIVEALKLARGRLTLRRLSSEIDLDGRQLSGTLGSMQKAANNQFGQPVVYPGPWFQNEAGDWDREYVLNTDIIPLDEGAD